MDALSPNERAVIGGNLPPEPMESAEFLELKARAEERIAGANRWITERPEITDADMADKAGGFKQQLADAFKALDDMRLQEGRDFKARQQKQYGDTLDLLKRALDAIGAKITDWLKREKERIAREQAEREAEVRHAREAAEAAAKKAAEDARKAGADALRAQQEADRRAEEAAAAARAAAAEPQRAAIKGDYTQRAMTLRTTWHAKVVDETAALRAYAKHPTVRQAALAAALKLADAAAKASKRADAAPPGFQFYSVEKA